MKRVIMLSVVSAVMVVSGVALADSNSDPYHPAVASAKPSSDSFKLGGALNIEVPSGVALGINARLPYLPWFKLSVSATYLLAPGLQGSVLVDPIQFPIAPVLDMDFGHQFQFTIPTLNNSPKIDFDYVNLGGGIALGSRDGFRFLILGGMAHLSGTAHDFQKALPTSVDGLTVSDPTFSGWIPTVKLGGEFLF